MWKQHTMGMAVQISEERMSHEIKYPEAINTPYRRVKLNHCVMLYAIINLRWIIEIHEKRETFRILPKSL